jgi:hypothetical protein
MPQATQSQLNIDQWAEGISQYEQGSKPDARSVRNNNPGNLKYAKQFGATGYDKDGFAVFESKELGMKALKEQLQRNLERHPDYTLTQHMHAYLGGTGEPKATAEGDPIAYASFLSKHMGLDPDSKLVAQSSTPSGAKPWAEIAAQFDPMMAEETYQEMKKLYFDNFIAPHLSKEDDLLTSFKYFDEKTKRPHLLTDENLAKLKPIQAMASSMHGLYAPFDHKAASKFKEIQDHISTIQLREGQNPAWEQIPGEMLGASAPLMLASEGAEPLAANAIEDIFALTKGANIAHRALRGGIAFAAYEAGAAEGKDKGVAALKGFVVGATLDGGLSLGGKLISRGVKGDPEELLKNALDPSKGVSLDEDRVIADQILQDQHLATQEGRSSFLHETHDVRGAQVQIKLKDGRVIQESILSNDVPGALSKTQYWTQQGGEVLGIDFQPGWQGKVQEFLALQNKAQESGYTSRVVNTPSKEDIIKDIHKRQGEVFTYTGAFNEIESTIGRKLDDVERANLKSDINRLDIFEWEDFLSYKDFLSYELASKVKNSSAQRVVNTTTNRILTPDEGGAEQIAEQLRSQGHPAEAMGDKVVISQPKKSMPSRDQIKEVVDRWGSDDDSFKQNVTNQIRQIWNAQVPTKSKRLMVDKLEELVGEKANELLPDEWKIQPKVSGVYKSEFEKWLYSLGTMKPADIRMANGSWDSLMNEVSMSHYFPGQLEEYVSDIEKRLPRGIKVPERFLPKELVPKPAGEIEVEKALGNHVSPTQETIPTLDVEESRTSKMQRLYNIVTGQGFGKGGPIDTAAERLLQDLGHDPYTVDMEELGFAPNFEAFQSELKGYEIIQSAKEEVEQKIAQTGVSLEESSALQEAARKGEIEPPAVENRIPLSERGEVRSTPEGPKWFSIHENEARIRIRVAPEKLEELLPGAAGAAVSPEFQKFRQDAIKLLGLDLDPRDPRPWHLATTPNRDYIWHENMHNGLYAITGKPAGMYNTWTGSPHFNTAEEIGAQLMGHNAYSKFKASQMIEEAFVHAATAVRVGDVNYLAHMAYWDTSIGKVLKMVEDFGERALQDAGLKADTIPIRQVKRSLDYVITKASSQRMGELVRLGREIDGLAFYSPEEQTWKYVDAEGKFRTSKNYGGLVDHMQDIASGQDFAPSASIWAEMRGLRGQMNPRGLGPTERMPMPEHSVGQDQKWVGWRAMEGAFRPMLPWVADLDTKLNEAFSKTGQRLPIYEKVKAVDDALKAGDDWLTNQKELAADFLKGNPKKLYSYMDALTVTKEHWPGMMDKLQLTPDDLKNLSRAEEWLRNFQNDTHIPAFNYLRDQLPRLRGFNFNPDFVYGRGAKLPSDMSFFHRAIAEGTLDPKDAHLGRFFNFLIREGFEKKFTGNAINELKKVVDLKDAEGKYILGTNRWPLNNYVNYVRGIPDVTQQVITRMSADFGRTMGEQFKKINPYLPEGFKLPEEVNYPGSIFNKLMTMSYVGALGARPAIFVRDVFQAATTTLPVLGIKNFIKGASRGLTSEGFARAEEAGALLNKKNIGEMYGDIFNELPAGGNTFDKALKLSSKLLAPSRWGHNVARAIAYNGEFDSTFEAVQKYRAGVIDADRLMRDTSIWFYDKPEINKILQMSTNQGIPVEEVAKRSALQLVDLTLWPYRRGAQPTLLRTGAGRIFGQFGMWPLNYMDFLRRMATKVSDFHGPALRTVGTWMGANFAAAATMEGIFHADVGKWFWLSPAGFGGSPHLELAQNLMKMAEETQEGREARRKVMEYPMDFVPASNEIKTILKSIDEGGPAFTDDGHLSDNFTRILGFKPLNETHEQRLQDLSPEDRIRYEFGYKKEKP